MTIWQLSLNTKVPAKYAMPITYLCMRLKPAIMKLAIAIKKSCLNRGITKVMCLYLGYYGRQDEFPHASYN